MPDILPAWSQLTLFLAASVVLAVTPGPGVVYIVTRSLSQGTRAGVASALGVAAGNLGNAVGAALGLAAVLAVSAAAFAVIKYLGAAYLVFLGVRALGAGTRKAPPGAAVAPAPDAGVRVGRVLRDGFTVALLNPKTALFFAAFLPQFLSPAAPAVQTLSLAGLFVLVAAMTDFGYAVGAGALRSLAARRLRDSRAVVAGRYITGLIYIGLGALTAFSGPRSAR
jgi:threonine/homoserine/homoserine lactone efflux protein